MRITLRPISVLKLSPTHGYVYIIKSDSGHYKIGKSVRPDKRVGEFSLQLPFKIEIIHIIECDDYSGIERLLHTFFRDSHVNGEWFSLKDEEIEWLKAWHVLSVRGLRQYFGYMAQLTDSPGDECIEMKAQGLYRAHVISQQRSEARRDQSEARRDQSEARRD